MSAIQCCSADGCPRPTRGGRTYCDAHAKRAQRGTPMDAPLGLDAAQRLEDAAIDLAEADSEDDRAYEVRRARLLAAAREWAACAATLTERQAHLVVSSLREQGKLRLGRPPVVRGDAAAELVRQHGGVRAAARAAGCGHQSIIRAIRRS